MRTPKPFGLPPPVVTQPVAEPSPQSSGDVRKPKPFGLPPPVVTSPAVINPRPINLPSTPSPIAPPRPPARSIALSCDESDDLVQRAQASDPALTQFAMRLKPRFSTLLKLSTNSVLNWGEQNVQALRTVSAKNAQIASRIDLIDPVNWIKRATEAALKPPGMLSGLLRRNETPAYFEAQLTNIRSELMQVMAELESLHAELKPDEEDLRMDIVSLQVTMAAKPNLFDHVMASERVRTLVAAQQTVVMVTMTLMNMQSACAQHVQTIDKLLTVTIPNWAMALTRK